MATLWAIHNPLRKCLIPALPEYIQQAESRQSPLPCFDCNGDTCHGQLISLHDPSNIFCENICLVFEKPGNPLRSIAQGRLHFLISAKNHHEGSLQPFVKLLRLFFLPVRNGSNITWIIAIGNLSNGIRNAPCTLPLIFIPSDGLSSEECEDYVMPRLCPWPMRAPRTSGVTCESGNDGQRTRPALRIPQHNPVLLLPNCRKKKRPGLRRGASRFLDHPRNDRSIPALFRCLSR